MPVLLPMLEEQDQAHRRAAPRTRYRPRCMEEAAEGVV